MKLKEIELKDGMIIETEREKYVVMNGYIANKEFVWYPQIMLDYLIVDERNLVKITYGNEILFERKKEILDKVEKKYLSAVIRPFRDDVRSIRKYLDTNNKEYISIYLKIKTGSPSIDFPYFEKGTMYKGMTPYEAYTLEDLGL